MRVKERFCRPMPGTKLIPIGHALTLGIFGGGSVTTFDGQEIPVVFVEIEYVDKRKRRRALRRASTVTDNK